MATKYPAVEHIGGSARVIRELVDHSAHHSAASRARAAFSARPEMSHTTFTVPYVNEPPRRHDITIRVAKEADRHTDPAAFAAAASRAAAGRHASILSAHTAEEIICVVSVPRGQRGASGRGRAGRRRRRAQRRGSAAVTQPVRGSCPLSCAGS
jgi:hypothetical protein